MHSSSCANCNLASTIIGIYQLPQHKVSHTKAHLDCHYLQEQNSKMFGSVAEMEHEEMHPDDQPLKISTFKASKSARISALEEEVVYSGLISPPIAKRIANDAPNYNKIFRENYFISSTLINIYLN